MAVTLPGNIAALSVWPVRRASEATRAKTSGLGCPTKPITRHTTDLPVVDSSGMARKVDECRDYTKLGFKDPSEPLAVSSS